MKFKKKMNLMPAFSITFGLLLLAAPLLANNKLLNAANKGDEDAIEEALAKGANINYQTDRGHTALMFSVKADCEDCVELLIKKGANLNLVAKANNQTALMLAIQEDKFSIAEMLVQAGAEINIIPKGGYPALVYAIKAGNEDLIDALLQHGADLSQPVSKNGYTYLHQAVRENKKDMIQKLLGAGASPNAQSDNGTTPLMLAAHSGCTECVQMLMAADADPEIKNKQGQKAILFAKAGNHREIIGLLDPDEKEAASLPEDKAVLFLTLIDTKKVPDPGVDCTLVDTKGGDEIKGRTDSKGQFKDTVTKGHAYAMSCDKFGRQIAFPAPMQIKETPRPLVHKQVLQITVLLDYKRKQTLKVNFASGSAKIVPQPNPELDRYFKYMEDNPDMKVELAGHTDSQGSDAYNMDLSRRRAKSCREYLINKGIDPKRIIAKGYGETEPIATNNTPAGRAKNRRMEAREIVEK
ncbi:MAG: ankyrin repeat domain-containing protein [Leptospiraceae bacterium]|nr:ankyrin repeat domain-containing protein [Leptospiraceae bacterium]